MHGDCGLKALDARAYSTEPKESKTDDQQVILSRRGRVWIRRGIGNLVREHTEAASEEDRGQQ